MSRQDSVSPRSAADLERKYQFDKTFAELMGISNDAQTHAVKAERTADEALTAAKLTSLEVKALKDNTLAQMLVDQNGIKQSITAMNEDLEGVHAQLDLSIKTDKNGNLQSAVNIGADLLTITTDYFQLLADGTIVAPRGNIGGWDIYPEKIQMLPTMRNKSTGKDETYQIFMNGNPYTAGNSIPYNPIFGVNQRIYDENGAGVDENGTHFSTDWKFYVRSNGTMYTKDIHAVGGTVGGWEIDENILKGVNGSASFTMASSGTSEGYFLHGKNTSMTTGYGNTVFLLKNDGFMYVNSLKNDSPSETSSDRNMKNTISDLTERYSLFFDGLRPVTYKYNSGTSDRLHVGLIAQEVDAALTEAGLSRQEFAGVCIENLGAENESWTVRYSEFIAILIREIQQLKQAWKQMKGEQI